MNQFQGVPGPSQDAFNSLSEQIATLMTKSTASVSMSVTAFNVPTVSKIGNIAYIDVETNQQVQTGSNVTIGSIPSGYRPSSRVMFAVPVDNGSGTIIGHAMITINTNGNIIANTSSNGFIPIKFSYII